jgi:hypothetical protein
MLIQGMTPLASTTSGIPEGRWNDKYIRKHRVTLYPLLPKHDHRHNEQWHRNQDYF